VSTTFTRNLPLAGYAPVTQRQQQEPHRLLIRAQRPTPLEADQFTHGLMNIDVAAAPIRRLEYVRATNQERPPLRQHKKSPPLSRPIRRALLPKPGDNLPV